MIKISHIELQGAVHKANNIPCQDKTYYIKSSDYACIALADGAGSRRFSDIGAQITTRTVCEYFCKHQELNKEELLNSIKINLNKSEYNYNDLSSTLLFVFVKNNKAIIGHIGDGFIIGIHDNKAEILSYPHNGCEPNITYFTTDINVSQNFRTKDIDLSDYNNYTFFLTSDGGGSFLFDSSKQSVAKAVVTIASWLKEGPEDEVNLALYNNLLDIAPKYTPDDVSIIEMYISNKNVEYKK